MNRVERLRALAALEAMALEIRKDLKAEAMAELAEHGTAPSWTADGVSATTSRSHDRLEVVDEDAFLAWCVEHHPEWVTTVVVPRNPKVIKDFLAGKVSDGRGPRDEDEADAWERGEITKPLEPGRSAPSLSGIPGVVWVKGGEFVAVSVTVSKDAKAALAKATRTALDGGRAVPREIETFFTA